MTTPAPKPMQKDAATRAVDKLIEQKLLDPFQKYNIAQVIRAEYESDGRPQQSAEPVAYRIWNRNVSYNKEAKDRHYEYIPAYAATPAILESTVFIAEPLFAAFPGPSVAVSELVKLEAEMRKEAADNAEAYPNSEMTEYVVNGINWCADRLAAIIGGAKHG